MKPHCSMGGGCETRDTDHGARPFCTRIACAARRNRNFRTAFWTGCHLQITLMSLPARCDIGMEMHPDTDQYIRVESGQALVRLGDDRDRLDRECRLNAGDAVIVPSGTWHNVWNLGCGPLKLSSVYAPPQHPKGTVHRTKADAAHEE